MPGIPPQAIEAAAKARYEDDGFFPVPWDDAREERRQLERDRIRPVVEAALTAAEPFLLGELRSRLLGEAEKLEGRSRITLTLDEATAVCSAAFAEDHDVATFDSAIKRLGDWIDSQFGLADRPTQDSEGEL